MDKYTKRENACMMFNRFYHMCETKEQKSLVLDMKQAFLEIAPADVVPKCDYDAVVSAVDNSTKEFLKLHDDYQKAIRKNAKLHSQMPNISRNNL